jgi:HEAT repeat protein
VRSAAATALAEVQRIAAAALTKLIEKTKVIASGGRRPCSRRGLGFAIGHLVRLGPAGQEAICAALVQCPDESVRALDGGVRGWRSGPLPERVADAANACLNDASPPFDDAFWLAREAAAQALVALGRTPHLEPARLQRFIEAQGEIRTEPYVGDVAHKVVREAARAVLNALGEGAVPSLIAALSDKRRGDERMNRQWCDMRGGSAWLLGRIGDPRAVQPLIACAQRDNLTVAHNAVKALEAILQRRAADIAIADLQVAAALADLEKTVEHWDAREGETRRTSHKVYADSVRRLALEELKRRESGVTDTP